MQEHHNPFIYKLVGTEALRALCEELNVPLACAADLSTSDAASAELRSQTASPSLPASALADDAVDTQPRPDSALVDSGGTELFAAGAHPAAAAGAGPAPTNSQQVHSAMANAGLAPAATGGGAPANARVGPEVTNCAAQQQEQQQRHEALLAGSSSAGAPGAGARRPQDILPRLAEICGDDLGFGQHQADMPASSARQRSDSPSPHVLSSGLMYHRAVRSAGSQREGRERHLERLLRAVEARSSQQMTEADGAAAPGSVPARRLSGAGRMRRRLSDPLERANRAYQLLAARPREAARPHGLALSAAPPPGDSSSGRAAAPPPLQTVTAAGQDALRRRRRSRHTGDGDSLLPLDSAESVPRSLRVVDHSAVGEPHAPASDPQSAAASEQAATAESVPSTEADSAPGNGSEAAAVEAAALAEGSGAGGFRTVRLLSEIYSAAQPPVAAAAADAGRAMVEALPVSESSPEPEGTSGIAEPGAGSGSGAPGGSASGAAAEPAPQEGPPPDTATDDDQDLIMLPPPEPTMVDLTVLVRHLPARSFSCVVLPRLCRSLGAALLAMAGCTCNPFYASCNPCMPR